MVQKERLFNTAELEAFLKGKDFTERPGTYGMGSWPCREFSDGKFDIIVRVIEKVLYDQTIDYPQKAVYLIPEGSCIAFVFPLQKTAFLTVPFKTISVKYY